jgi:hypothetical protein
MMRHLVPRTYEALRKSIGDAKGRAASHAAHMPDFYCRMKSLGTCFDQFSIGDTGKLSQYELAQRIRFLERMFEANVCYFQKNIERHCSPEANDELKKFRSKFDQFGK